MDFSDRIWEKQSYGNRSVPETLEARIARLQREVEEVRHIVRENHDTQPGNKLDNVEKDLKAVLANLQKDRWPTSLELYSDLGTRKSGKSHIAIKSDDSNVQKYIIQLSSLESRLSKLESVIGANAGQLDLNSGQQAPLTLILQDIRRRISLLASSSAGIDKATSRVKDLASSIEKLRALRVQQQRSLPSGSDESFQSAEINNKIMAVYDRLNALGSLSAIVPKLIDRLKSLQAIHADAGSSLVLTRDFENTIEGIKFEYKSWIHSLEKMESKLTDYDAKSGTNREALGKWIKSVEQRVEKLTV